jgi:hypothetical protein
MICATRQSHVRRISSAIQSYFSASPSAGHAIHRALSVVGGDMLECLMNDSTKNRCTQRSSHGYARTEMKTLSPDCGLVIRALAVAMDVMLSFLFESWFFEPRIAKLVIALSCIPQFATRTNTSFDEYLSIICNASLFMKHFIMVQRTIAHYFNPNVKFNVETIEMQFANDLLSRQSTMYSENGIHKIQKKKWQNCSLLKQ